jgi:hypothetical protein
MSTCLRLSSFAALWLASTLTWALPAGGVDDRLMSACAARLDARMDSMGADELEYIRRLEFSLRMAMAPFAAGDSLSYRELAAANEQLNLARYRLASACGVPLHTAGR